jgi:hypothetical protein
LRKEFEVFRKQTLKSIVTTNDAGELDFFGGVARRQDIDVLAFYRFWKNRIPLMTNIILEILSIPIGQASSERIFSRGRYVLNDYRSSLLPARGERLILSGSRASFQKNYANRIIPRIVDIGVPFTDDESVEADDARGDDEEEEAEEKPWYER